LLLAEGTTDQDVQEEIIPNLASKYDYSEQYRGIDYEIVPNAPLWVITDALEAAKDRRDAAEAAVQKYTNLLPCAGDCRQCKDAVASTYSDGDKAKTCPTCGREINVDTLAFWLMPDDTKAVQLLKLLVEKGPKKKSSQDPVKMFKIPHVDEEAYARLSKLGLVMGSAQYNTYTIQATKSGEAEWARHAARLGQE